MNTKNITKKEARYRRLSKCVAGTLSLMLICATAAGCSQIGPGDNSDIPLTDAPNTPSSSVISPAITSEQETEYTQTTETEPEVTTEQPATHTLVNTDGIWYVDGVLIANKSYPLPADYAPGGLLEAAEIAFMEMKNAAARDGITLTIVSGYRSYARQEKLYNNYVTKDGQAEADRYSARPGHSEHQSGLAMDLNSVDDSFADTKEAKWIAENCAKYGFIIRYPKDKEEITGYIYEPWHVRYLGVDLAEKITASGLCFEEYFGITSEYDK